MLFPQVGYSFEEFVEATGRIHTKERLFELLISTVRGYGYDRINFSIKFDSEVPLLERRFGLISTYPEDWQQHYADKNYANIDPVLRWAVASTGPFTWRDIERRERLTRKQTKFLREGEDAGLYNGIGLPFPGPHTQIAGVALATSEKAADRITNREFLFAVCNHFYYAYKRIIGCGPVRRAAMTTLSPREIEILQWSAYGKRDDFIADKLGISISTVQYFSKSISQKLGTRTRVQAIVLALISGIIEP